jgi:hypothetical protein
MQFANNKFCGEVKVKSASATYFLSFPLSSQGLSPSYHCHWECMYVALFTTTMAKLVIIIAVIG